MEGRTTRSRPWFRLASMARLEPRAPVPAVADAPATRPPPSQTSVSRVPRAQPPPPAPVQAQPQPPPPPQVQPSSTNGAPEPRSEAQQAPRPQDTVPPPSAEESQQQGLQLPPPPPPPPPPPQSQPPPPPPQVQLSNTNSAPGPRAEAQQAPGPKDSLTSPTVEPQQKTHPPGSPSPPLPLQSQRPSVPSRSPTPPGSPRVIKQSSPNWPESPRIRQVESVKAPQALYHQALYPEPEPEPEPEPKPKQLESPKLKTVADMNEKQLTESHQANENSRDPLATAPKKATAQHGASAPKAPKKDGDGEAKVITMAGENTGAYMELGSLHRQHSNWKQLNGHKLQDETQSEDVKKKKEKGRHSATEERPIEAVVNSNVQSANNSIVFSSSFTHRSPGVHFALLSQRKPKRQGN